MKLEHVFYEPTQLKFKVPLLFVHGAWHGAWCWDQGFMSYFKERGFAVHALSLRGHGDSDGRDRLRRARIADYVEDVARIAMRLPSKPIVIGHSMGGAVVQKYLETHAAPAAVLMASMPPSGVFRTVLRTHTRYPLTALRLHLTLSLLPLVNNITRARELFFSERITEEKLRQYASLLQNESYMAFLDMLFLNLPKPERVATQMLVLGAENDTIFTADQVRETATSYGTEATLFPDMAHDMMLEQGWESVADLIFDWLQQTLEPLS